MTSILNILTLITYSAHALLGCCLHHHHAGSPPALASFAKNFAMSACCGSVVKPKASGLLEVKSHNHAVCGKGNLSHSHDVQSVDRPNAIVANSGTLSRPVTRQGHKHAADQQPPNSPNDPPPDDHVPDDHVPDCDEHDCVMLATQSHVGANPASNDLDAKAFASMPNVLVACDLNTHSVGFACATLLQTETARSLCAMNQVWRL